MVKDRKIGVLGLQGDFALHQKFLRRLNVDAGIVIRSPQELDSCDGLIIPGGESTTFLKLFKKTGMLESLLLFAEKKPVMGTCAGLITLSKFVTNGKMDTLGLIDLEVERNGYGRQKDSFMAEINIPLFKKKPFYEGVFIRAPRIISIGSRTEAIGFLKDEIVMVRNRRVLAMTFHPELTNDLRIHSYFMDEFLS